MGHQPYATSTCLNQNYTNLHKLLYWITRISWQETWQQCSLTPWHTTCMTLLSLVCSINYTITNVSCYHVIVVHSMYHLSVNYTMNTTPQPWVTVHSLCVVRSLNVLMNQKYYTDIHKQINNTFMNYTTLLSSTFSECEPSALSDSMFSNCIIKYPLFPWQWEFLQI